MQVILILFIILIIAIIGGFLFAYFKLNNQTDKHDLEFEIKKEVEKYIQKTDSVGIITGVFKKNKAFIQGYGSSTLNDNVVPQAQNLFQIGSITKVFTSLATMILAEEGKINLDDTLENFSKKFNFEIEPKLNEITVRHLLCHTSGFPVVPKTLLDKIESKVGKNNLMINPYSHIEVDQIIASLKNISDYKELGKFEYSNFGMGLLGHILEMLEKKPLESILKEKIFSPLGMINTKINLSPEDIQSFIQGYDANKNPSPLWTFKSLGGAGAVNSNISDMLRFIKAALDKQSFLQNSLLMMYPPQFQGQTGLGWMQPSFIDQFWGNKNSVWHNGMVGGYTSYILLHPKDEYGIIVLSNKSVDLTLLGMSLSRLVRIHSFKESLKYENN